MTSRLSNIQNMLDSCGILTCFSGRFSQGLIEEIGEALKKHLENEDIPKNDISNVFRIFVELSQNIKNYVLRKEGSSESNRIACSAIICIGQLENGYFIWSGNLVENADIAHLNAIMSKVTGASKEELKQFYREQILKDVVPGQLGAGVGLIDIARRARLPLEFTLNKLDEAVSVFEISVIV